MSRVSVGFEYHEILARPFSQLPCPGRIYTCSSFLFTVNSTLWCKVLLCLNVLSILSLFADLIISSRYLLKTLQDTLWVFPGVSHCSHIQLFGFKILVSPGLCGAFFMIRVIAADGLAGVAKPSCFFPAAPQSVVLLLMLSCGVLSNSSLSKLLNHKLAR